MTANKLSLSNTCLFKNFIRKKKVIKKIKIIKYIIFRLIFLVFLYKIGFFAFHSIFATFFIS